MTRVDDIDRTIEAWLGSQAPTPTHAPLLGSVLRETAARRPRAAWLVRVRRAGIGPATSHRDQRIGVRRAVAASLVLLLGVALAYLAVGSTPRPEVRSLGAFHATGAMATPRASFTATLLLDGRVLVAGGVTPDPKRGTSKALSTAELYDPASGSFTPTGSLLARRVGHTATLLQDGRVLIVGGNGSRDSGLSAELYDPDVGAFVAAGTLGAARQGHTATALVDGTVLIAGGAADGPSLERFDPDAGTFADAGGSMAPLRWGHTATRLGDGRILLVGGLADTTSIASAELYDPTTRTSTPTGSMAEARWQSSAVLLPDGDVLVIGGTGGGVRPEPAVATVERYRVAEGAFVPRTSLLAARTDATATALPDGRVLIVGGGETGVSCCRGLGGGALVPAAELYDAASDEVVTSDSMPERRQGHAAVLLSDGRVLLIGGRGEQLEILASAELFE